MPLTGVPVRVIVTPEPEHWGELEVGFAGVGTVELTHAHETVAVPD